MFDVQIKVLNMVTGKEEKPTKYNTFFDENGRLQGIQNNLKIVYRLEGSLEHDEQ